MCYSATARPTHEAVVGRAVFVTWNPPTTARSRTRTGFVFCFFPFAVLHQPNRRGHRHIRVMCHSSSDVLARPRRPPPESSVESSAPESANLRMAESCGVAHQSPPPSPVAVPARVVPTSPPKSSEALLESQQIRPPPKSLHGVPTIESFNKPRQARPVFVRVTRQALQARPPSQSRPPSSAVHAKVVRCPCRSPAKSADRPGICAPKSFLGCPVPARPQSSAVPARVARRPRQGLVPRLPPESSAVPARIACRPRQGLSAVPASPAIFEQGRPPRESQSRPPSPRQTPPESSAKSPPL